MIGTSAHRVCIAKAGPSMTPWVSKSLASYTHLSGG